LIGKRFESDVANDREKYIPCGKEGEPSVLVRRYLKRGHDTILKILTGE